MLTRQKRADLIICAILCAKTSKERVAGVHMDSQIAWNMWTVTFLLVHFAEGTGGKLATFTVVNLIANISHALITVQFLCFFPCCAVVCCYGIFSRSVCNYALGLGFTERPTI